MTDTAKSILNNLVRDAIHRATGRNIVLGQDRYHTDAGLLCFVARFDEGELRTEITLQRKGEAAKPIARDEAVKLISERLARISAQ